jgi:hypothetical protein
VARAGNGGFAVSPAQAATLERFSAKPKEVPAERRSALAKKRTRNAVARAAGFRRKRRRWSEYGFAEGKEVLAECRCACRRWSEYGFAAGKEVLVECRCA